jgi:hypothetical protein
MSSHSAAVGQPAGLRALQRFAVAAALTGFGAAGCTTSSTPPPSLASGRGPTVAFESVDGLPEDLFSKLVQELSVEAETRQVAVVSRQGPANYRVRGYAAAEVRRRQTAITWVWDVYDAEQRRTLRIAGAEPAVRGDRGWSAADDQTLRRMARKAIEQLSVFLANPDAVPAAPPPPTQPADDPAEVIAAGPAVPTAAPSRRPGASGLASHAALSD